MQTRDDAAPTARTSTSKSHTTVAARVRPWLTALDGPNDIASTSAVSATGVRVRSQGDAGRGRRFRLHHAVSADDATFCDTVIAPFADLASRGGTACVVFYGASGAGRPTPRARPSASRRNGSSKFYCRRVLPREIAGESCCDFTYRSIIGQALLADASGTIQPVGLSKNQCD